MLDPLNIVVEGHILIKSYSNLDGSDEQIVLNKRNAVHSENMSLAIARALSGSQSGHLYSLAFGNGGSTVDNLENVTYSTPNTTGAADLHSPTYTEVVDPDRGAPVGNSAAALHISGTLYSDIEVRCVLDKTEPAGQDALDSGSSLAGSFVFDEIGLKSDDGLLLTHAVFSPVQKSANRVFEVVYTLRIRIS